MLELNDLFLAFHVAAFVSVVTLVLMRSGYILEWYLDLLIRFDEKHSYITKPLGMCEACMGGQLSLWLWLCLNYHEYEISWIFALPRHLSFIMITILFISIIKKQIKQ